MIRQFRNVLNFTNELSECSSIHSVVCTFSKRNKKTKEFLATFVWRNYAWGITKCGSTLFLDLWCSHWKLNNKNNARLPAAATYYKRKKSSNNEIRKYFHDWILPSNFCNFFRFVIVSTVATLHLYFKLIHMNKQC